MATQLIKRVMWQVNRQTRTRDEIDIVIKYIKPTLLFYQWLVFKIKITMHYPVIFRAIDIAEGH